MDYSCRDIPMRLDIKHQPLSFDIYLSQMIDIPRTSIEESPYDFNLELEALSKVDKIIERTQQDNEKLRQPNEPETSEKQSNLEVNFNTDSTTPLSPLPPPPPSCPTETLLTPIRSSIDLTTIQPQQQQQQQQHLEQQSTSSMVVNRINPSDFEDIHYNPFDHLELQTIDERKELDLVFQASYANKK